MLLWRSGGERFLVAGYNGGWPAAWPRCRQGGSFMFVATTHLPDPHDPFKAPGWRWLRTGYLLDHNHQPLRQDDDATRQAWLFRRTLTCCRTDATPRRSPPPCAGRSPAPPARPAAARKPGTGWRRPRGGTRSRTAPAAPAPPAAAAAPRRPAAPAARRCRP